MLSQYRFLDKKNFALFLVTLCITANSGFAAGFERDCAGATELASNTTLRGFAGGDDVPLFRLDLAVPGIVTVDLATAGPGSVPAKIDSWKSECGRPDTTADAAILEQSATHLALAVRTPGTIHFRAAARDRGLSLGLYKVTVSFVEARVVDESLPAGDGGPDLVRTDFYGVGSIAKNDPEPVDPDPGTDPWTYTRGGGRLLVRLLTQRSTVTAVKNDPEPVDPDPGTLRADAAGSEQVIFYERTCVPASRDELDDHGDTLACATPLGVGTTAAAGEIGNAWRDDVDVFALTLSELTTLEVTATGDVATLAALYDRFGQQLVIDPGSDGGSSWRATLAAGRYFVRLEGRDGAEGAYRLSASALGW